MATCARCGGICNNHFTTNLQRNFPLKIKLENRLRFDSIMAMSLWPHFLAHPVYCKVASRTKCAFAAYFLVFENLSLLDCGVDLIHFVSLKEVSSILITVS